MTMDINKRDEIMRRLAQASLAQAQQKAATGNSKATPPIYMLPTAGQLRRLGETQRMAPRLPPPGKIGMWVWFMGGDPAGETMLKQVLELADLYKSILVTTYYCVILPRRFDKSVSFQSVINEKITAIPDLGGRIAQLYANGQVPSIIRVFGDDRRLVSVRQMYDFLQKSSASK